MKLHTLYATQKTSKPQAVVNQAPTSNNTVPTGMGLPPLPLLADAEVPILRTLLRTRDQRTADRERAFTDYMLAPTAEKQQRAIREYSLCTEFDVVLHYIRDIWGRLPQLEDTIEWIDVYAVLGKRESRSKQATDTLVVWTALLHLVKHRSIDEAEFHVNLMAEYKKTYGFELCTHRAEALTAGIIKWMLQMEQIAMDFKATQQRHDSGLPGIDKSKYVFAIDPRFNTIMVTIQRKLDSKSKCKSLGYNYPPTPYNNKGWGFHAEWNRPLCKSGQRPTPELLNVGNYISSTGFVVDDADLCGIRVNELERRVGVYDPELTQAEREAAAGKLSVDQRKAEILRYHAARQQPIYFPVQFSGAGRLDVLGYAGPQGDSFEKAMLRFEEYVPLGEHGLDAISACFCEAAGFLSKAPFEQRAAFLKDNPKYWQLAVRSVEFYTKLLAADGGDTDAIYEALSYALEYKAAMESGDPENFPSNIICHQDLTASGAQHIAAWLGSRKLAEMCNITANTHSDPVVDFYTEATLTVEAPRYVRKAVTMTGGFYGAGVSTISARVLEKSRAKKDGLYNNTESARAITALAEKVMYERCPELQRSRTWLKNACKRDSILSWDTPNGYNVEIGRLHLDNCFMVVGTQPITLPWERKKASLDMTATQLQVAPLAVHSMDATHLQYIIAECKERAIRIAPIHDSFGTHAGNYMRTNRIIRSTFADVHRRDENGHHFWSKAFGLEKIVDAEYWRDQDRYDANEAINAVNMAG
ncbi:DNA-directed RNA polymerase [Vibrio astriarenae]